MKTLMKSAAKKKTLQDLVDDTARFLGVDAVNLYVCDPVRQELILTASHGLRPGALGYRMPIRRGLTGLVARSWRIVNLKHPEHHPDFHQVEGSGEGAFHSYCGIPLLHQGDLLGVLVIQSRQARIFQVGDLSIFCHAARVMIDNLLALRFTRQSPVPVSQAL